MSTDHSTHAVHEHVHTSGCEHTAVQHDGHVDYPHDGHLHHPHDDHVDEHTVAIDDAHPDGHTQPTGGHADDHVRGSGCGHDAVPHGEHTDYLVDGTLHHPHDGHCDDHGALTVVS